MAGCNGKGYDYAAPMLRNALALLHVAAMVAAAAALAAWVLGLKSETVSISEDAEGYRRLLSETVREIGRAHV